MNIKYAANRLLEALKAQSEKQVEVVPNASEFQCDCGCGLVETSAGWYCSECGKVSIESDGESVFRTVFNHYGETRTTAGNTPLPLS